MKILLVRHGKTEYNTHRKYTGFKDIHLSNEGIESLKKLKSRYDIYDGLDVYTSKLIRTIETANVLFPKSKIVDQIKALNEMNLGDFEGHSYHELKDVDKYKKWLDDIYHYKTPNGESFEEFRDRVIPKFVEIVETLKEDSIFVLHGGTIQLIMSYMVDQTTAFFDWKIQNGLGYILEFDCLNNIQGSVK